MDCPKCGSDRVDHEAPGPGLGGLCSFRCRACGYEESGIADPGRVETHLAPRPEPTLELDAPCSVCGRPGRVQNLPGVPASDSFCEEHAPGFVLKPIAVVLVLAVAGFAAWLIWALLW